MLALCIVAASCVEEVDGCLDIRAVNFQADADNGCGDCCTFPVWNIQLRHRAIRGADTTIFSVGDSVYVDDFGQPYRFASIRYFLSGFQLRDVSGNPLGVTDSIGLFLLEGGAIRDTTVEDNFILANPEDFTNITLTDIIGDGKHEQLCFSMGLPDFASRSIPDSIPTNHPLATAGLYQVSSGNRLIAEIALFRDTLSETMADTFEIEGSLQALEICDPVSFSLTPGFDVETQIEVNYLNWMQGIDVRNEEKSQIAAKLYANFPTAFRVLSVELEID